MNHIRARYGRFALHLIRLDGVGYGLGPTALASVPEVRYDLDHSTLSVGAGWNLDVGNAGDFRAVRELNNPTEAQRDAAYAWYYDSAPTGPDGGRVRFQNSQPGA